MRLVGVGRSCFGRLEPIGRGVDSPSSTRMDSLAGAVNTTQAQPQRPTKRNGDWGKKPRCNMPLCRVAVKDALMGACQQEGKPFPRHANSRAKAGSGSCPLNRAMNALWSTLDSAAPHCTCPEHETRGQKCTHFFAVEFVIQKWQHADGGATIPQTVTITDRVKKPTDPQDWLA